MDSVTRRTVEVEADSLEEAMKQIEAQVGEGQVILTQKVLSDGEVHAARGDDETSEGAFEKAATQVPEGAEEVDRVVATPPGSRNIEVEAFDERAAQTLAGKVIHATEVVGDAELAAPGSKGLLGIGKKPNRYRVEIRQRAIVDIMYRQKARVSAVIGEPGRTAEELEKLDRAEASGNPVDLVCEQCGQRIKALAKPVSPNAVMVMTPEIAVIAARYCEACNIIVCGACVGVSSASLGASYGGRRCPRCREETEYAAIPHVRRTETKMV